MSRLCRQSVDPYPARPKECALSPYVGHAHEFHTIRPVLAYVDHLRHTTPEKWQETARDTLAHLVGFRSAGGLPDRTSAGPVTALDGDIVRQTHYLRVRPMTDMAVTLVHRRNLAGPAKVFLYLAGSTSGVHLAWGETKVPIDHMRLAVGADLGIQAARRGYLAVCIEQPGFGEREERDLAKRSADRSIDAANHALLLGRTLMGEKAMDVSAAIDWILSAAAPIEVDPDCLFLFGHSAGGSAALYAAALDTRIQGVLCSGSIGRFRETLGTRGNDSGDCIIPGLMKHFEAEDIIALIAPRRFVAISGDRDHIFPFSGVADVVRRAHGIYEALGASDAIAARQADGPHRYYPLESWAAWRETVDHAVADDPGLELPKADRTLI